MNRNLRIANILFWLAVWATAVIYTRAFNAVEMILEGLIPLMMSIFIHIALRPNPENSPKQ